MKSIRDFRVLAAVVLLAAAGVGIGFVSRSPPPAESTVADNAASKTLQLGTTARVTNVETGQSAKVTIQDRGPYVKGRIVDLSPATAREIGLDRKDGVATVVVAPIAVPLPDGGVKRP